MNLRPATLAALLLTGCSGAATPDAPKEELSGAQGATQRLLNPSVAQLEPPRRYALISQDTDLSSSPRPEAEVIQFKRKRAPGERALRGQLRALRYIGEQAGWATLETIPTGEADVLGTCYNTLEELGDFRLRVYVPSTALITVTEQRLRQDHSDGTWIELAAGVALLPDGEQPGRFIASLNDLLIPLQLTPAQTNISFTANALPSFDVTGERYAATTSLTDSRLTSKLTINGQPLWSLGSASINLYDAKTDEPIPADHLSGRIERGCAKMRAIAPSAQTITHKTPAAILPSTQTSQGGETNDSSTNKTKNDGEQREISIAMSPGGDELQRRDPQPSEPVKDKPKILKVPAGTKVYWRDGSPAGVSVKPYPMRFGMRSVPHLKLKCFVLPLSLTLCRRTHE
jgi:hypothetical protein